MKDEVLVFTGCEKIWPMLRGKRVFLSGGTGFFGKNILDAIIFANQQFDVPVELHVLSREPESFLHSYPQYSKETSIHFLKGDVKTFQFPPTEFDYVLHAATETNKAQIAQAPFLLLDNIIEGTRHMLDFTRLSKATRFLLVSSGAVYGDYRGFYEHVPEECCLTCEGLDIKSVYAQGKRTAELLTRLYAKEYGFESVIARGFAFTGNYLPLDQHFAIGNFIRDALAGRDIQINGDGTPMRSYLHTIDLVSWLLTLLVNGKAFEAYNTGSDEAVSITQLAEKVSKAFPTRPAVNIAGRPEPGQPISWYVPSVEKAKSFGLQISIPLEEAIQRTIDWNKK